MEAVIIAGNYLIMLMFFLSPAALVAIDFVFFVKKKEQPLFELCAFFVRGVYDRYGYPLSRHINSAWSADVVYLLMKPLERAFVLILYLLEERPEDRICRQYLPQGRTIPSKQGKNVIG